MANVATTSGSVDCRVTSSYFLVQVPNKENLVAPVHFFEPRYHRGYCLVFGLTAIGSGDTPVRELVLRSVGHEYKIYQLRLRGEFPLEWGCG